jgi:hypothetical protein
MDVTGRVLVLVASRVGGGQISERRLNSSCLMERTSGAASITTVDWAKSARFCVVVRYLMLIARFFRFRWVSMYSLAFVKTAGSISNRQTLRSTKRAVRAIPLPIVPAPATPIWFGLMSVFERS